MGWVVTLFGVLAVLSVFPGHTGAIVHAQKDAHEGASKLQTGIDWDKENKLPPWMSSITEGARQAIAVVLGQSLKPDGSAPQVLLDRAAMARKLLKEGAVTKVVVSGGDPANVGHTEASMFAKVLVREGIPEEALVIESQATTTAENAWFLLRWIPKGTGRLFIITSDFHMPRATYIFKAVLNHFYMMLEERYKKDPRWTSKSKRYPRLELVQAPTASFCGADASRSRDHDKGADINAFSLAKRARDELRFLGSGEVVNSLYGEPVSNILYIWPIQINVTEDPDYHQTFPAALAEAENTAEGLCECVSPPDAGGAALPYPLQLPVSPERKGPSEWQDICSEKLI